MPKRPYKARYCDASCEDTHLVRIHLAVWCEHDYINARGGIILFRLLAMSVYGPGTCIKETMGLFSFLVRCHNGFVDLRNCLYTVLWVFRNKESGTN